MENYMEPDEANCMRTKLEDLNNNIKIYINLL